jgi:hypothetical protein
MLALSAGLFVLWWLEVQLPDASRGQDAPGFNVAMAWMTWMHLLAAVGALFGAIPIIMRTRTWAMYLCAGLTALWIAGLTGGAPVWMTWWSFAFAAAMGGMAMISSSLGREESSRPGQRPTEPVVHEHRRAA